MFSRPELRRTLKKACYEAERIAHETGNKDDIDIAIQLNVILAKAKYLKGDITERDTFGL